MEILARIYPSSRTERYEETIDPRKGESAFFDPFHEQNDLKKSLKEKIKSSPKDEDASASEDCIKSTEGNESALNMAKSEKELLIKSSESNLGPTIEGEPRRPTCLPNEQANGISRRTGTDVSEHRSPALNAEEAPSQPPLASQMHNGQQRAMNPNAASGPVAVTVLGSSGGGMNAAVEMHEQTPKRRQAVGPHEAMFKAGLPPGNLGESPARNHVGERATMHQVKALPLTTTASTKMAALSASSVSEGDKKFDPLSGRPPQGQPDPNYQAFGFDRAGSSIGMSAAQPSFTLSAMGDLAQPNQTGMSFWSSKFQQPGLLNEPSNLSDVDDASIDRSIQNLSGAPTISSTAANSMSSSVAASLTAADIGRQVSAAMNRTDDGRIEISLNPAELGKVRMTIGIQDQVVTVFLSIERSETADLMRRHADQLQADFEAMGYQGINLEFADGEQGDPKKNRSGEPDAQGAEGHESEKSNLALSGRNTDGGLDLKL